VSGDRVLPLRRLGHPAVRTKPRIRRNRRDRREIFSNRSLRADRADTRVGPYERRSRPIVPSSSGLTAGIAAGAALLILGRVLSDTKRDARKAELCSR
jgi:hypothetical protein